MRFLILAAATLLPATSAAAPPVPRPAMPRALDALGPLRDDCRSDTLQYAWRRDAPVRPHKLNELPDANSYAAAYRRIDGCEAPIVIRFGLTGR